MSEKVVQDYLVFCKAMKLHGMKRSDSVAMTCKIISWVLQSSEAANEAGKDGLTK